MLSDFLTLELYFGHEASAQFFEDLSRKYGIEPVKTAFQKGDLQARKIQVGPDSGRMLCWLSDQARNRLLAGLYAEPRS